MKRRDIGLIAGAGLVRTVLFPQRAHAAAPDPSLLGTVLTPMGAERAGTPDGSIPAWTGGMTAPPLPAGQKVDVQLFTEEQPLYTVSAGNMAQYGKLLSGGVQRLMTKFGLVARIYRTHRTAAAPQYVYDNIARNVTRARFDPKGGRFGFTGAVGGVPFPIIDTSDPQLAGTQLIWNHLTTWNGYSTVTRFAPAVVVSAGTRLLTDGTLARTIYPYYDPAVTPETFDGYYSKGHYYTKAPPSADGQETLVWHSTNVNIHPDIVWTLVNGQGRVRKAPDEAYDTPNPYSNGIANEDESDGFYGNPSQYDWTCLGKQEMLVPYNCNAIAFHTVDEFLGAHYPNPEIVRWEKHRVWVLEATLHPGRHNVNARRRFYLDEDTWSILLGESFDHNGNMVKCYIVYNTCIPSLPGTVQQGTLTYNLITGDYVYDGNCNSPPYNDDEFLGPQPDEDFQPEQMAASASF